jgi:hypothetical protein
MNWANLILSIGIITVAVILAIFTDGMFLPASLPMTVYALQRLGIVT